jgi:hypothetical protein
MSFEIACVGGDRQKFNAACQTALSRPLALIPFVVKIDASDVRNPFNGSPTLSLIGIQMELGGKNGWEFEGFLFRRVNPLNVLQLLLCRQLRRPINNRGRRESESRF